MSLRFVLAAALARRHDVVDEVEVRRVVRVEEQLGRVAREAVIALVVVSVEDPVAGAAQQWLVLIVEDAR